MAERHIVAIGGSDAGISAACVPANSTPTAQFAVVVADISICGRHTRDGRLGCRSRQAPSVNVDVTGRMLVREHDVVGTDGNPRVEHHNQRQSKQSSDNLGGNEARSRPGGDTGEAIGEHPADRDGRVGERRRAGKPVRRADVRTDRRSRHCRTSGPGQRKNQGDQTRGCDDLADQVAEGDAVFGRQLESSAVEHHVGQHRAADATDALRHGVEPERRAR
jgi:hypothetical protein